MRWLVGDSVGLRDVQAISDKIPGGSSGLFVQGTAWYAQ